MLNFMIYSSVYDEANVNQFMNSISLKQKLKNISINDENYDRRLS